MQFKARWLSEPIELAEMPLKGIRETKAIDLKVAELHSMQTKLRFISFGMGILAAQRILKALGAKKAKESWDDYILTDFDGAKEFIWPQEKFEENLKETAEKMLLQNLGAGTYEDAAEILKAKEAEIGVQVKGIDKSMIEAIAQKPLLNLYWRLKASGVKTIQTAHGPVDLDWSEAAKAATMDALSEVATETDLKALQGERKRPFDMEELRALEPAEVEGKSGATSKRSTRSSPVLEPFSELTTETTPE